MEAATAGGEVGQQVSVYGFLSRVGGGELQEVVGCVPVIYILYKKCWVVFQSFTFCLSNGGSCSRHLHSV